MSVVIGLAERPTGRVVLYRRAAADTVLATIEVAARPLLVHRFRSIIHEPL